MISAGSIGLGPLKQRRFERLLDAGLVAFGIVDLGVHLDRLEQIVGGGLQQRQRRLGASVPLTSSHASKCSDGSTTGMRSCNGATVRLAGQVRIATRIDLAAFWIAPALIDAGKGDQLRLARGRSRKGRRLPLGPVHS